MKNTTMLHGISPDELAEKIFSSIKKYKWNLKKKLERLKKS
jgi:hypothetical protein